MDKRRWLAAALVLGLATAGCGGEGEEPEEGIDTEVVPAGAIPAAPDARPGGTPELDRASGPDSAAATGLQTGAGTPAPGDTAGNVPGAADG